MENLQSVKKPDYFFVTLLLLTILSAVFWLIGLNTDVYEIAFVGAVFEILWLPIILFTFLIPITSLIFWIKNKVSLKSKYLYLLLVSSAIIYLVVTSGNN